jgi:peptidyl-prolyl cis-trans isomerase B (cyclophilin B)
VVALVGLLGCGGCVGTFFYLRHDGTNLASPRDRAPAPAGPSGAATPSGDAGSAPGGSTDLDCRMVEDAHSVRDVGRPDFAAAQRSGVVTMRISTNRGEISVRMDRARTPCTVASFAFLATRHYFDQTSCHRLTASGIFVLQCGDPEGDGTGGPGYRFRDENLGAASYRRGVVAMANAGPNTNGSQFFIVYQDSTQLQPNYTPFGEVTAGMEIVDAVAAAGTNGSPDDGSPRLALSFLAVSVS